MKHRPAHPFGQGKQRVSRKQAKAAAHLSASVCFDRTKDGKLVRVTSHKARAVLERAFTQFILRGGEPFAMQISASEAASFPSHVPVPGGSYGLAVGLDVDGCGMFSTAGAATAGGDQPVEAAEIAQLVAMMGLRRGPQEYGIPGGGKA